MTDADLVRPGPLKDAFDGKAEVTHAATHAVGGADEVTPASIGAVPVAQRTTRTNGLIGVWVQDGVTPSDADGGAAGGDSTAEALEYLRHLIDTQSRTVQSISNDDGGTVATVTYSDGTTADLPLPSAGGSSAVASVNGSTGNVVLDFYDVGALPATYMPAPVDPPELNPGARNITPGTVQAYRRTAGDYVLRIDNNYTTAVGQVMLVSPDTGGGITITLSLLVTSEGHTIEGGSTWTKSGVVGSVLLTYWLEESTWRVRTTAASA